MKKFFKRNRARLISAITAIAVMSEAMTTSALALGLTDEKVNVTKASTADPDKLMGNIFGILLAMTRYVGIGLVIYGVFEVVQSYNNSQPEAKVKGVTMCLSGCVCIGLKKILKNAGVLTY